MLTHSTDAHALLQRLPIFAEVDPAAVARLAERCVIRGVGAGHLLFRAGDPCRGLYVVAEGRGRVFRVNQDGREQVLHVEVPGRAVAELPLFDGGTYPASAMTLEPSVLLFLPREAFEGLYRGNPDVAHAIIRALGKRLRHLVQVAETLAFRDVAARLALLLAGYAEQRGEPGPDGVRLTLLRTQEELALEIGTARESVSRAFRQLERRGLVVREAADRLLLPNVLALREISRGE
jgi:CRP/FNR family transcriptional regulator